MIRLWTWLRRPFRLFILLAVARRWLPGHPSGELLLVLSFPLAYLFQGLHDAVTPRLTTAEVLRRAARSALRRLVTMNAAGQFILLAVSCDKVLHLRQGGVVALLLLILLRVSRGLLTGDEEATCSVLSEDGENRYVALLARYAGEAIYRISGNIVLLFLFLLLLTTVIPTGLAPPSVAMLAWVVRRNRHYLAERGWQGRQVAIDLLELEEPYRWLVRLALVYGVAGCVAVPGLVYLTQTNPAAADDPQIWQALTFLIVSVPLALYIHVRPRFGGVFLAGWCCCTMYVALLQAILEPARLLRPDFVVGEFVLPLATVWYLRTYVTGYFVRSGEGGDGKAHQVTPS